MKLLLCIVLCFSLYNCEEEEYKFEPIKFEPPKFGPEFKKPYFFDYFEKGSKIGQKWVKSEAKKDGIEDSELLKYNGEWSIAESQSSAIKGDLGLIVKTKARHHAISAKLDRPFNFGEENLIVQYEVKFEEGQDCGGGYLKLLSEGSEKNLGQFNDKTPYTIMFGPDKCGNSEKLHLIFRYKNPKNNEIEEHHADLGMPASKYWNDHQTHLYKMVVKPNGDYAVYVDNSDMGNGNMLTNLKPALEPPKKIDDPTDVKPADWDERAEIEDMNAVKPEDWDEDQPYEIVDTNAVKPSDWLEDESKLIADPEASKPADWDDDMDGEWEPPLIDNPACAKVSGCGSWSPPMIRNPKYKGKWMRPLIANPEYKGKWSARQIDNPHYFEPKPFAGLAPITAIGFELWTMSENIVFDNVLITSSEADSQEISNQLFTVKNNEEYRMANENSGGIIQKLLDATEEKPWLWGVLAVCLLIPFIFIAVYCFGRKSKYPKIDSKEEKEEYSNIGENKEASSSQENSQESSADEQEGVKDEESQDDEPGVDNPTEEVFKNSPKSETGAKRRKPRRGD